MSSLVGKLATGVGLVAEATQHHKAKKAARREQANNSADDVGSMHSRDVSPMPEGRERHASSTEKETAGAHIEEEEEEQWELDEAQDELVGGSAPHKSKNGAANPDKVVQSFLDRYPAPDSTQNIHFYSVKLEYPVVLPQRRPGAKKRGFIRAYAPDLQNKGIDQTMWLDFIETFNEASLANPWINAVNLASLATNALPSAIGFAVSTAIMIATQIAMETQGRYRQNKSLAKLNDEFFRPRGLYCLVMTWDPKSASSRVNADINSTIKNTVANQGRMTNRFQSSSGTTTQFDFMQTAELVFPGLDYIAAAPGEEAKGMKTKLKRSRLFVSEYMDRKAQAKFVSENPDNLLSNELKPTFASKFADPNHPIHSGSLVSLISLGYINPRGQSALSGGGGGRRGLAERLGGDASYGGGNYRSHHGLGGDLRGGLGGDLRGRGLGGGLRGLGGDYRGLGGDHRGLGGRGGGGLLGSLVGLAADAIQNRGQQNDPRYQQNDPRYQQTGQRPPWEDQHQRQQNYTARQSIRGGGADRGGGPLGLNKLLKEKVLYLMVVDMPTENEMSEARRMVAEQWGQGDEPPPYEEVEM